MTIISPPIPPFNNPPIQPQFFAPSQFFITAVTLGILTTVTTAVNNNFVIGQLVRLLIPQTSGCRGLNEQTGYVVAQPAANQVTLNINSQNINPFVTSTSPNQPQIVPVGDVNNGIISATGRNIPTTNIPGSFINISP